MAAGRALRPYAGTSACANIARSHWCAGSLSMLERQTWLELGRSRRRSASCRGTVGTGHAWA
jgi:hypothetical protein